MVDNTDSAVTLPKSFKLARAMSWLFIFVSIVMAIYTFWRSEILFQGIHRDIYMKYYVISLIALIFWGIVSRLRDKIQLNIVMVTTSIILGFYTLEIGLYVIGYTAPIPRTVIAERLGIPFDNRTGLEVYKDLRVSGVSRVSMAPTWIKSKIYIDGVERMSLGGLSNATTIFCNMSGDAPGYVTYLSDRFGFNNPDSEWDRAQVKGLLIGDSFTHGVCVKPGDDITSHLRQQTGEAFINLGIQSTGPLHELATLVEYGEIKKPKHVFWLYYEGNDLGNLLGEKQEHHLMRYLNEGYSQGLMHYQDAIDKEILSKTLILENSLAMSMESSSGEPTTITKIPPLVIQILKLANLRWASNFSQINFSQINRIVSNDRSPYTTENIALFQRILRKTRDLVQSRGGNLYFVYLSQYSRYKLNYLFNMNIFDHKTYRKRIEIIDAVRQLEIPVIDIHEKMFATHPNQLDFFSNRAELHYSAKGYRKVAKIIIEEVEALEYKP